MNDEGRDVFVNSRNAMAAALLDAGVDPLITGTVMTNFEQMGFYLIGLKNQLTRLEQRVARQDARQSTPSQQETTSGIAAHI